MSARWTRASTSSALPGTSRFLSVRPARSACSIADAELATARAAKAKNALQILSTVTSVGYEDIAKARGGPVWYQLYAPAKWEQAEHIIKRVEAAGCPALALTVDLLGGRNTETYNRARRADKRDCNECHDGAPGSNLSARPMFKDLDMTGFQMNSPSMTWDFVDRVKKTTKMKFLLKGLESREDAQAGGGAWRRRHYRFEPRRALDGDVEAHDRVAA